MMYAANYTVPPETSLTRCTASQLVCMRAGGRAGGGGGGREVIHLHAHPKNRGRWAYLLLTYGVPHVDWDDPCAVTRTNFLLPPGRTALETCPHTCQHMPHVPSAHAPGVTSQGGCAALCHIQPPSCVPQDEPRQPVGQLGSSISLYRQYHSTNFRSNCSFLNYNYRI
jgi:hypothetical protein